MDPKQIVSSGYDVIASRYTEHAQKDPAGLRQRYARMVIDAVSEGASLLDLGCGSGLPVTLELARHFRVTGVDISARQIESARANVLSATFLRSDMAALAFPPASFDAVVAFYSIIHVPRTEHPDLLRAIASWLTPGGLLVATMGVNDNASEFETDWLGASMYWSHYDSATNQRLVCAAGLEIARADVITSASPQGDDAPETSLWIVARKPAQPAQPAR